MSHRRYLSANSAAKLLQRCTCSENFIVDALIRKAEYAIRISASKRSDNVMWRVPIIYASVPAYNYREMHHLIAEHLRKHNFFVKEFPDGSTMWISWRRAFDSLPKKH